MDKKTQQKKFQEEMRLGITKPKTFGFQLNENKHGVDNPVQDLNIKGRPGQGFPLSALEAIPDHTYIGNTSGIEASPSVQNLGVNTHFITKDNKGVTVVNGLVTLVTTTSTSSSSSSSSSSSVSTSSSSVSTSSSSSSLSTSSSSSS